MTRVAGLELLEWGAAGAPPLLCLHGFPDVPASWAPVAARLVAAGWRVVAPYMRGYAPSTLAGPFTADQLAADAIAIADALSPDAPIAIVGHDWGAVATYAACARAPERFARAVTMAVPHPAAFLRNLRRMPSQLLRSWYMGFFQLPRVPERALRRGLVRRLWRRWSPSWDASHEQTASVERCLDESLPAPLEYYRQMARALVRGERIAAGTIRVPTLALHGAEDGCVDVRMGAGQERFFSDLSQVTIAGAGHFLQLEQPEVVARHIVGWIS